VKHFDIAQWTDFVRDIPTTDDRTAMEQHLSSGCSKCRATVAMLRQVIIAAQADAACEVPDYAVRNAKAIFALQRPEKVTLRKIVAQLVFDSFLQPLPAGVRASQQRMSRQALYQAGDYCIDVRIEHERGSANVVLVGQISSRREPSRAMAGVPVLLMSQERPLARGQSNEFGEFQMRYRPSQHLSLHVPVETSGEIEVPLKL
jgi:hypothetical protein